MSQLNNNNKYDDLICVKILDSFKKLPRISFNNNYKVWSNRVYKNSFLLDYQKRKNVHFEFQRKIFVVDESKIQQFNKINETFLKRDFLISRHENILSTYPNSYIDGDFIFIPHDKLYKYHIATKPITIKNKITRINKRGLFFKWYKMMFSNEQFKQKIISNIFEEYVNLVTSGFFKYEFMKLGFSKFSIIINRL